jgi:hypothetical protein
VAFKLADLFVEISAKGNLEGYLKQQQAQAERFAAALNNGGFKDFAAKQQAVAKQMQELQERAMLQAGVKTKSPWEEELDAARMKLEGLNKAVRTGEYINFLKERAGLQKQLIDLQANAEAKAGLGKPSEMTQAITAQRGELDKLQKAYASGEYVKFLKTQSAIAKQMQDIKDQAAAQAGMSPLQQQISGQIDSLDKLKKSYASGEYVKFLRTQNAIAKQMEDIKDRAEAQAGLDQDRGALAKMGIDPAVLKSMGEARREMTRMQRAFKALGGEMGQGMGTAGEQFQKALSRKMEPSMKAIQKQLVDATIKMRGWGAASGTAFKMFIAGDTALGKFRFRLDEITKRMDGLNKVATTVFVAGSAAVAGFVAAASPDAFNTLTLSFKLLSAEIGGAFIPYVAQAVVWIQKAAYWVHNLSDEQKDNYAKWILWGLGISGATMIVLKFIATLPALIEGFRSVGFALMWIATTAVPALARAMLAAGSALMAHPIIAGVLILITLIGILIWKLQEARQRAKEMREEFEKINPPPNQNNKGGLPGAVMGGMVQGAAGAGNQGRQGPGVNMPGGPIAPHMPPGMAPPPGIAEILKGAGKMQAQQNAPAKLQADPAALAAFQMRPQITSIADAWKNAQMQIKSPLEAKLLQLQQDNLKKLIEQLEILNKIEQNGRRPLK